MRYGATFLCPNTTSLTIQGNFGTREYQYIEISITGCELPEDGPPEEQCYNETESKDLFSWTEVKFITLESNIDFSKKYLEDVITYTTDYDTYFLLDSSDTQTVEYNYMKSTMKLDNEAFTWIFPPEEKEFFEYRNQVYHRSDVDLSAPIADRLYFNMVLQKTDKKRLYIRQTESLLIFFGDLGGLIEILRLTIGVIIFPFITRQIMAAIASENYQVQKYTSDSSEYYQSK